MLLCNIDAWGARGRKFESCRPDQSQMILKFRHVVHPKK